MNAKDNRNIQLAKNSRARLYQDACNPDDLDDPWCNKQGLRDALEAFKRVGIIIEYNLLK